LGKKGERRMYNSEKGTHTTIGSKRVWIRQSKRFTTENARTTKDAPGGVVEKHNSR